MTRLDLRDRRVVVTGAAHGLGRALAESAAARGALVTLLDVDDAGLGATADALTAAGARAQPLRCDVSVEDDLHRAAAAIDGPVALLLNNAGVSVQGPFEEVPLDDMRWLFGINFWGTVHACRALLPKLRAAATTTGAARIVNVLSDFGLVGFPTKSAYCASKFAARGFGDALRAELHGSGVGVLQVYPPAIRTDILTRSRAVDATKRDLEARFLHDRGWPARAVADRILHAAERGRDRLLLGKETRAIDLATRAAPVLTQRALGRYRHRLPFV